MTYTYKCNTCNHVITASLSMKEKLPATKTCPECQGVMIREFHPVPIIFKGDGWGRSKKQ